MRLPALFFSFFPPSFPLWSLSTCTFDVFVSCRWICGSGGPIRMDAGPLVRSGRPPCLQRSDPAASPWILEPVLGARFACLLNTKTQRRPRRPQGPLYATLVRLFYGGPCRRNSLVVWRSRGCASSFFARGCLGWEFFLAIVRPGQSKGK